MSKTITNCDNVIDSRDVIERIEELREQFTFDLEDADSVIQMSKLGADDTEELEELASLLKLQAEAECYAPDWHHGATLIREDYFQEYAQVLAEDIGAVNRDAKWPNNCIDWEQAAEELKVDYTTVEFSGTTYYVR